VPSFDAETKKPWFDANEENRDEAILRVSFHS
jgi:hypothetical protein